jgi:hypothetical protein
MTLWQLVKAIPRGLAALIVGVGVFLHKQWNQYTEFGQFLWLLALVAMAVDAGISYEFGRELSLMHAAGFALVALAFCILPDVAAMEWHKGRKSAAGWIGAACIPLGFVAFFTHVGYSASIRVGDMQQTGVQNTVHADTRKAVSEAEGKIKFFTERIASLKAANPWVTTVSADGLKGRIPAMEESIAQESRRGGCGPKCLALKEELAGVMEQIGAAEQLAEHEKMLAAAHDGLSSARGVAAKTAFVSSAATNHNDTLFKAINLAFSGDFVEAVSTTQREATNTGIMGMSSIAFLLLAPLFYFAAGLNRRHDVMQEWIGGTSSTPRAAPLARKEVTLPAVPLNAEPAEPRDRTSIVHISDRSALKVIADAIQSARQSQAVPA